MNGVLNTPRTPARRQTCEQAPPPARRAVAWAVRGASSGLLAVVAVWVFALGGVGWAPAHADGEANDTGPIFNWHPLLMTLAFPVLMAEAVLAYQAPLLPLRERPARKLWHFGLHTAAVLCMVAGITAAWKSHTLKRPVPIPNLYSPHSWLGCGVLALVLLQYCLGFAAFLFPRFSPDRRAALAPLHGFLGRAIFVGGEVGGGGSFDSSPRPALTPLARRAAPGLATTAVGLQEKATLVQLLQKPSLTAAVIRLPAAALPLLLLLGGLVMYLHVPLPPALQRKGSETPSPHDPEHEPLRGGDSSTSV